MPCFFWELMENITTYQVLLAVCSLIVISYFFTVINRLTRIPSVLLLLGAGIFLRWLAPKFGIGFQISPGVVELLGTIGLIMIVLEAGLDLHVTRDRMPLIRNSFFSALVIFVLSTCVIAGLLTWWMPAAPLLHCVVYAIPLSIVSSAIVLPSVHHLSHEKKEFLIYEASFSDILGIMAFNFFTASLTVTIDATIWFGESLILAVLLSVLVCLALMWLLVRNRIQVKFFLVFAVLIIVYTGGKMLHLPSLITILIFGLVVNNWELLHWPLLQRIFPVAHVDDMARFLKSITAESSFLIRTFFFVIFGFQIDLAFLHDPEVWQLGSAIVAALLLLRFIYLRILHRYNLFPEMFYIPRGLITVLLFYKIPEFQKISNFNEGVLFFVILATGLILMAGSIFYRDEPVEMKVLEEEFDSEGARL
ncbi:MAG: cation:proton antiporter [Saprospiraceae bacterium]|nr:cation:proton antiporter [Saprospiraceae bacterium]